MCYLTTPQHLTQHDTNTAHQRTTAKPLFKNNRAPPGDIVREDDVRLLWMIPSEAPKALHAYEACNAFGTWDGIIHSSLTSSSRTISLGGTRLSKASFAAEAERLQRTLLSCSALKQSWLTRLHLSEPKQS
jgi:hypothetical protein